MRRGKRTFGVCDLTLPARAREPLCCGLVSAMVLKGYRLMLTGLSPWLRFTATLLAVRRFIFELWGIPMVASFEC